MAPAITYDWDPGKDRTNRRKHRLSLEDGIPALEDPYAVSWVDDSSRDELRFVTLGVAFPNMLVVMTTEPEDAVTRIISVRKAQRHEEGWYRQGHPETGRPPSRYRY